MSEKKVKKPEQSVQYLLHADHKRQRLSLKKLSERLAKARRTARSSRSRNAAGPTAAGAKEKQATGLLWGISSRAIMLGMFGLVAAAALFATGQPSSPADVKAVETPATSVAVKKSPSVPTPKKPAVAPTKTPAAATKTAADSRSKAPAPEPAAKTASVESTAKPDARNAASVTITGCLQHDEQSFWLKDLSGADAPKTRSWRSGFLTKRPARVEVVDAARALKLSNYVGQRVAATGALMNRELQVHSLQRVAASCN